MRVEGLGFAAPLHRLRKQMRASGSLSMHSVPASTPPPPILNPSPAQFRPQPVRNQGSESRVEGPGFRGESSGLKGLKVEGFTWRSLSRLGAKKEDRLRSEASKRSQRKMSPPSCLNKTPCALSCLRIAGFRVQSSNGWCA